MKDRQRRQGRVALMAAVIGLCTPSVGLADPPGNRSEDKDRSEVKEWDEFKVFIEICGMKMQV